MQLRLLAGSSSVYDLAGDALAAGKTLTTLVSERVSGDGVDYEAVYRGDSPWRLLPPIDHPAEPTRCLVSGTGLTHLGSARDRQAMHTTALEEMTDSMRMFRWGLEGGRPEPGRIGAAPEWFYKGTGTILRAHGEPLLVPSYAEDGGEEAEVAGIYVVDAEGRPRRLGMAVGERVLRPPLRAAELLEPRGVQAPHLQPGPRAGGGSRLRLRARPGRSRARRKRPVVEGDPHG